MHKYYILIIIKVKNMNLIVILVGSNFWLGKYLFYYVLTGFIIVIENITTCNIISPFIN